MLNCQPNISLYLIFVKSLQKENFNDYSIYENAEKIKVLQKEKWLKKGKKHISDNDNTHK